MSANFAWRSSSAPVVAAREYRTQQTSGPGLNANALFTRLALPAPPKLVQIALVHPDDPTGYADVDLDGEADADADTAAPA